MSKIFVDTIEPKTSGGAVLIPNRPAFNVQITTTSATNSENVFSLSRNIILNQGNHWQASGSNEGKFVAPFAGLYYFNFEAFVSNSSNTNAANLQNKLHFTKNGNTLSDRVGRLFYMFQRYEDYQSVSHSEILLLEANDAIGVRIEQGQGYVNSSNTIEQNPRFYGYLIG